MIGDEFREGDQVRLIAPFRCSGDSAPFDESLDRELRRAAIVPEGEVIKVDDLWVQVDWNEGHVLWCDPECVEIINDPTPQEIEAAIRSITQGGE